MHTGESGARATLCAKGVPCSYGLRWLISHRRIRHAGLVVFSEQFRVFRAAAARTKSGKRAQARHVRLFIRARRSRRRTASSLHQLVLRHIVHLRTAILSGLFAPSQAAHFNGKLLAEFAVLAVPVHNGGEEHHADSDEHADQDLERERAAAIRCAQAQDQSEQIEWRAQGVKSSGDSGLKLLGA